MSKATVVTQELSPKSTSGANNQPTTKPATNLMRSQIALRIIPKPFPKSNGNAQRRSGNQSGKVSSAGKIHSGKVSKASGKPSNNPASRSGNKNQPSAKPMMNLAMSANNFNAIKPRRIGCIKSAPSNLPILNGKSAKNGRIQSGKVSNAGKIHSGSVNNLSKFQPITSGESKAPTNMPASNLRRSKRPFSKAAITLPARNGNNARMARSRVAMSAMLVRSTMAMSIT